MPEQSIASIAEFDQLPIAGAIVELDGRVVAINARCAERLARRADEVVGHAVWAFAPELEGAWPYIVAGVHAHGEHRDAIGLVTPRGRRTIEYVATKRALGERTVILAFAIEAGRHDVARAGVSESSQRLESLGVVAGGIAHDFNNQLVGVLAEASAMSEDTTLSQPVRDALARIEAAAKRMAQLTRQLLAYAGRGRFVTELIDPDDLVAHAKPQLERAMRKGVAFELATGADVVAIQGDRALLRQVVVNVVANAAEAVDTTGGRVAVTTGTIALGGRTWWQLVVSDNGAGMDASTIARIFDPFFTTKTDRHGLGLSAVQGIVRRLGGEIDVESAPGSGTRMQVRLPIVPGALPKRRKTTSQPAPLRTLKGTRVLLADDEPSVRATVRRLLERRGAVVTVAGDGGEAEAQLRAGTFGLVLLDVMMPVKGGYELLAIARATQPHAAVMLMSGYTDSSRATGDAEPDAFLEKPFTTRALDEAIDDVLAKR